MVWHIHTGAQILRDQQVWSRPGPYRTQLWHRVWEQVCDESACPYGISHGHQASSVPRVEQDLHGSARWEHERSNLLRGPQSIVTSTTQERFHSLRCALRGSGEASTSGRGAEDGADEGPAQSIHSMSTAEWRAKYEKEDGTVDLWVEEEFNAGSRLVVSEAYAWGTAQPNSPPLACAATSRGPWDYVCPAQPDAYRHGAGSGIHQATVIYTCFQGHQCG